MKKQIIFLALLAVCLFSCEKNDEPIQTNIVKMVQANIGKNQQTTRDEYLDNGYTIMNGADWFSANKIGTIYTYYFNTENIITGAEYTRINALGTREQTYNVAKQISIDLATFYAGKRDFNRSELFVDSKERPLEPATHAEFLTSMEQYKAETNTWKEFYDTDVPSHHCWIITWSDKESNTVNFTLRP